MKHTAKAALVLVVTSLIGASPAAARTLWGTPKAGKRTLQIVADSYSRSSYVSRPSTGPGATRQVYRGLMTDLKRTLKRIPKSQWHGIQVTPRYSARRGLEFGLPKEPRRLEQPKTISVGQGGLRPLLRALRREARTYGKRNANQHGTAYVTGFTLTRPSVKGDGWRSFLSNVGTGL